MTRETVILDLCFGRTLGSDWQVFQSERFIYTTASQVLQSFLLTCSPSRVVHHCEMPMRTLFP